MGTSVQLNNSIILIHIVVLNVFGAFLMSLLESIGLFIKHVPTQAEAQVHRTAPCDDSWGLQVFQKMRHKLEYSGDETLLGCMKKFHMELYGNVLIFSIALSFGSGEYFVGKQ